MFKSIFSRIKDSIKNFSSDVLPNLEFLISVCIVAVSFISGIVGYVKFILAGSYIEQVEAVAKKIFFIDFTIGSAETINSGIAGKIIMILLLIQMIVMIVHFFAVSSKIKKIIMTVNLSVLGISTLVAVIFYRTLVLSFVEGYGTFRSLLAMIEILKLNPDQAFSLYISVFLTSIVSFSILVLITKECRRVMGYSIIALLISNIAVPIIILFFENLIPLISSILGLIAIGIGIYFLMKVLSSGEEEGELYRNKRTGKIELGERIGKE